MVASFKGIIYIIGAVVLACCMDVDQKAPYRAETYTLQEIRSAAMKADSDYSAVRTEAPNQGIYEYEIFRTKESNQGIYEYEIPPKYWNDVIKSLNPVRVYDHRLNVAIAISVRNGIEEGIYIHNVVSSYIPLRYETEVEDGFTFLHPANGSMINYRRRIMKK
jgi:hypothetical protein